MINGISEIRFSGSSTDLNPKRCNQLSFSKRNLARSPLKDEVAFTGAVLSLKDLKAASKIGIELVTGKGRHGTKLLAGAKLIPLPVHSGGEIAKGTAHQIAKQLGYSNVQALLKAIRG